MAHTKELKQLLQKRPNWLPAFEAFSNQLYGFDSLVNVYNELIANQNILKNLPKPVAEYRDINELTDDYSIATSMSNVRKLVQECPSVLKEKLRRNENKWSDLFEYANEFAKLEKNEKRLFIASISKHKTYSDFRKSLVNFIEHVKYGVSFYKRIKEIEATSGAHLRIVDIEHNIIIARVTNATAISILGRGTQWCIADPSPRYRNRYWPNYVANHSYDIQYVLFDYNYKSSNPLHEIGVTVRNGRITNAHKLGNNPVDMEKHIDSKSYLKLEYFKGVDEEAEIELFIDGKFSMTETDFAERVINTNYVKRIKGFSPNKIAKIFSRTLSSRRFDNEKTKNALMDIFSLIGDTKFFNHYIPFLHYLDKESLEKMVRKGLVLKYSVHLEEILTTYFRNGNQKPEVITFVEIKRIDGIEYEIKTVKTLTPLNTFDIERLKILINTNPKVLTRKIKKLMQEFNIEL